MRTHCAALLFDIDGTLVDSSGPIARAWALFIERYGVDATKLRQISHGRRDMDIVAHFLPPEQRAEGVRLVRTAELTDLDGLVPVAGALELINSLGPLPWALVTSATVPLADVRLKAVGLPHADVMVTAEDVERGKPDPAGYLLAAGRLGVDPADCIVVEDAPAGLAAAAGAGCRTLAVTMTHQASELTAADWIVPDLRSVRIQPDGAGITLDIDPILQGATHAS